jgi:uncharacterized protein (DUF849 family)
MDTIVNLAPTGVIPTREMTPHVPISPTQIVDDVLCCYKIGITTVHLHVRDEQGKPTLRTDLYARVIEDLRKHAPELVICVSLSGRIGNSDERDLPLKELTGSVKPDMGSLTLSSLNFPGQASVNAPETVKHLAGLMKDLGILPELEVFDLGMANYIHYLIAKDLLEPPFYANLFLGNVAGAQLNLLHAGILLEDLPKQTYWSMAGIGDVQLAANALGIAMGGGVRVGIEDSIWYPPGREVKATNTMAVRRIRELSEGVHMRGVMSPEKFRELLQLPAGGRKK